MTTTPSTAGGPVGSPVVSVGGYTLLTKLGEGGMGIVHLARRPGGDRVALKVLRPHVVGDDEARARLAREVASLGRIRSRWVAEILDADPWAPVPYVATRYVPGLSLHDHATEEGPVEGRDLLWFASCLAEGVASVHAAGVLHRDVKPSNVLLEGRTPILIDFGLARVADDPRLTHAGWLLGTPGYLAPEILYGDDASPASDVHSWASTVAFAATTRPPFGRGPSMAVMDRVRRGEHDLTGVPAGLRALLTEALAPEPHDRPTLPRILERLAALAAPDRSEAPTDRLPVADPAAAELTVPVGVWSQRPSQLPTDVLSRAVSPAAAAAAAVPAAWSPAEPDTRVLTEVARPPVTTPWEQPRPVSTPAPVPDRWDDLGSERPGHSGDPGARDPEPAAGPAWGTWEPAEPRAGLGERVRRGALLAAGAAATGAAVAAAPWVTLVLLVLGVWLLRSGSLAASAAGDRRRLRGRRWYDGALLLVRAPWDLVRSIPVTVLLVLWSAGLAVSAALLCYAAAASEPVSLAVVGVVGAVALWTGPGGSRVRAPVRRATRPLSRSVLPWLAALVVLGVLAGAAAWHVRDQGPQWAPGQDRPLAGWSLPLPG